MNIAVYDLEISPITFDCIKFYLLAAGYFKRIDESGRFDLVIVLPSERRLRQLAINYGQAGLNHEDFTKLVNQRINNVLVECARLIKTLNDVSILSNRDSLEELLSNADSTYPSIDAINACQPAYGLELVMRELTEGRMLPSLVVPAKALKQVDDFFQTQALSATNVVTITLRQCEYQQQRNSELAVWEHFAQYLTARGFTVVWIPDVEALKPLEVEFGVIYEAATDAVLLKAACYHSAAANYFVNSGNAALARFNHHAISVCAKLELEIQAATTRRFWLGKGIIPGEQFSFLSELHLQIWQPETEALLQESFSQFVVPKIGLNSNARDELLVLWKARIQAGRRTQTFSIVDEITAEQVYLWCPGHHRKTIIATLKQRNVVVTGLIDSFDFGITEDGVPVYHPLELKGELIPDILVAGFNLRNKPMMSIIKPLILNLYGNISEVVDGNAALGLTVQ